MDDSQMYITEKTTIFVYSLKDFKFKFKFGKAGEGPQEFRPIQVLGVMVVPQDKSLFIASQGKVSYFTKDGKFIRELRTPPEAQLYGIFQPIGDKYIGLCVTVDQSQKTNMVTNLYDANMNKIKQLTSKERIGVGGGEIPVSPNVFSSIGTNLLSMNDDKEFAFDIINLDGKTIASYSHPYEPIKLTEDFKTRYFKTVESVPEAKPFMDYIKKITKFRTYFPVIQALQVFDNKIYALTYKYKDGKAEFFIFDSKAKFLKQVFLPLSYVDGIVPVPFTIKKDRVYQIEENDETEEYELHSYEIK